MDGIRHFLRLAGRLPDVLHVLSVGAVRLAEPEAQEERNLSERTLQTDRSTARRGRDPGNADRLLPDLSRICGRPERSRLLGGLAGASVLAERAAVVPMATACLRPHRRRALPFRAALRRSPWAACLVGPCPPNPVFPRLGRRLGHRLHPAGSHFFPLEMDAFRRLRFPIEPPPPLSGLFPRRSRHRGIRARARPARSRWELGKKLGRSG